MMARFWLALALMVLTLNTATAGSRLVEASSAQPLPAWVAFCEKHPDECEVDPLQPEFVAWTDGLIAQLTAVNTAVNRALIPMTDENHWKIVDLWSLPDDNIGDCEDYQLLKRKRLIAAGIPSRSLRMTVVLDRNGAGHAVLTVRTDRGDLILDNITDEVLDWTQTGYTFIKRESDKRMEWVFLAIEPVEDRIIVAGN
jgi:predicted transglutaminase-like cysteine proteinase